MKRPLTCTDLDRSHWATALVSPAAVAGLFQGYPDGSFRPSTTITRAEFLAVLMRAYPFHGPAGEPYVEIPPGYLGARGRHR